MEGSATGQSAPSVMNHPVLRLIRTPFRNNRAESIGAGLFLQIHENENLNTIAHVIIKNCTFRNNTSHHLSKGQGGTAVHVSNFRLSGYVSHQIPQFSVIFEGTTFENNIVVIPVEDSLGCGALFVSENAQTVINNSSFLHNNCSGIAAVQSTLVMKGNITITNNTAYNGGGVVLCANSIMFLSYPVMVIMQANHAHHFGGGIYAEFECSQAIPPCFYASNQKKTSVILINNTADQCGSAVYGGSVDHCFTSSKSVLNNGKRLKFNNLFNISHHANDCSTVASNPYKVCFCDSKEHCHGSHVQCNHSMVYNRVVYPGQTIRVKVFLAGQRNGKAPGYVLASTNTSDFAIHTQEQSQVVSSQEDCTSLNYTILTNNSSTNKVTINLAVENIEYRAVDGQFNQSYVIVKNVRPCPLGFEVPVARKKCDCSHFTRNILKRVTCNISPHPYITRDSAANWWLGPDTNSMKYCPYCPFDFCKTGKRVNIDPTNISSVNSQCSFKRTDTLCGSCTKNYSIIFGSSRCKKCSGSTLSVIGWTFVFAVLGMLLVLFLGFFNLNVAEGTLNATIFYMNVVRVNSSLFFGSPNDNSSVIVQFFRVFVAWMNLDLAIEMCYIHKMNALQKTALQFVFPFYLWILTGCIIYFSRHSSYFAKVTGKNSVKLLATIVLLSYTKIIRTIIDVLWSATLYIETIKGSIHRSSVWKMDGNVLYLHHEHQYLFVFAVSVAICTLPYTLSLLFIQCLNKWSHLKVFFWVAKLKPFFDAYTGPYKDKYHFWTGLLLLVRIGLFVMIANNATHGPTLNLTLITISAAVLFLINQPASGVYKLWQLSLIEAFSYFNLIILSMGTAYVISYHKAHDHSRMIIVTLCVGSMFLLFCGVIAYNASKMMLLPQKWGVVKVWLQERDWPWGRRKQIRSLILPASANDSNSSSDDDDEMDSVLHNAPPVAHFHEYREPLIETTTS